jgi:TolB-like protein
MVLVGGALVIGAGGLWRHRQSAPIPLAVLPFANLSVDAANEYFADGLTVEIIRNLSIIDGLAVRSQTSSFTFKGKPGNVRQAGKELEAEFVLEGSVLRSGQQVRIDVQLVRVHDDFLLWSGRFDRELADVVTVQDEIARGITNNLRLKLGRGRRRYETSAEAYDLYLQARASGAPPGVWGTRIGGATKSGPTVIDLFEKAIAKDPSFAPAYAGLAAAYAFQSGNGFDFRSNQQDMEKMLAAAEKAIQLDPLLAEAHSALGVAYARNGQWKQAEVSLRRAIAIAPNLADAHFYLTWALLLPVGPAAERVSEARTTVRLDPLSAHAYYLLANALLSTGQYNEAEGQMLAHVSLMNEHVSLMNECVGRALVAQGRITEAIRFLAAIEEKDGDWGYLAYAYARGGRRADAEKLMAEAPARHPNRRGPFQYALAYAGFEDKEQTIEQLERMSATGPLRIGFNLNKPEFAFVRGDVRVKSLRKKLGLPD